MRMNGLALLSQIKGRHHEGHEAHDAWPQPKTPDLAAAAAAGSWAVSRRREPRYLLMAKAAFAGDSPPTIAPGTAGPQVRRIRTFMAFTHFMVSALLWR
jgi:hypothetical protein